MQAQEIPVAYDSVVVDYANPKQYVIGGVTVTGTQYLDKDILVALSGIRKGETIDIPGLRSARLLRIYGNRICLPTSGFM